MANLLLNIKLLLDSLLSETTGFLETCQKHDLLGLPRAYPQSREGLFLPSRRGSTRSQFNHPEICFEGQRAQHQV